MMTDGSCPARRGQTEKFRLPTHKKMLYAFLHTAFFCARFPASHSVCRESRRAAFFSPDTQKKTQKTFLLELDKYGKAYHNYNSNAEPFKRGGVL